MEPQMPEPTTNRQAIPARIRYLILRGPSFRTPDEVAELERWNSARPAPPSTEQQRDAEFTRQLAAVRGAL
jgi:hypothetical protein